MNSSSKRATAVAILVWLPAVSAAAQQPPADAHAVDDVAGAPAVADEVSEASADATATATDDAAASQAVTISVMDLQAKGVEAEVAETISSVLTVELSRYPQLKVISSADIRRMLDAEATKQAAGCDETSCLAEIASALGARYLVWGEVGKLDDLLVVTLNLLDADKQASVGREIGRSYGLAHAPKILKPMTRNLVAPLLGHSRVEVPDAEPEGFSKGEILGLSGTVVGVTGLVVAGVGVVLFGGAYLGEIIGTIATSGGGYEFLIPFAFIPLAGPILVMMLGMPTCLELGAGCLGFALQTIGCVSCLAGGAGAGAGFLVPMMFGGDDEGASARNERPPPSRAPAQRLAAAMPY